MTRTRKPSGKKLLDKGKPEQERPVNSRQKPPHFLIVCEGQVTETSYFKGFRLSVEVEVLGTGCNTEELVRFTQKKQEQARKEGRLYQDVWVVFDRDDFPPDDFNNAIEQARKAGIHVAYSNEAFELWYILHFDYMSSGVKRERYQEMLSNRLHKPYRKNDVMIYHLLENLQEIAIQHAENLLASYQPHTNPESDNPSTTVHQLVKKLNEYLFSV
jgi:hypothetical protein